MNVFVIAPLKAIDMMDHARVSYLVDKAEIPVVGLNKPIEEINAKREAVHVVRKLNYVEWSKHFEVCFKQMEQVDIVLDLHIVNSSNFASSPREVILKEYADFLNIPVRSISTTEGAFYAAGMPTHGDVVVKF